MPEPLGLGVGLNQRYLVFGSPGETKIVEGHLVNRKNCNGRTELRAHVANRGAVCKRHARNPGTVKLDKLTHDTVLPEHLGDGENDICGGSANRNVSGELETDHLWYQHRNRLAQHGGLGFDSANTPTEHT